MASLVSDSLKLAHSYLALHIRGAFWDLSKQSAGTTNDCGGSWRMSVSGGSSGRSICSMRSTLSCWSSVRMMGWARSTSKLNFVAGTFGSPCGEEAWNER